MSYEEAIEKLSIYFSSTHYQSEVLDAKSAFFGDVGVDDKESHRYEQWMNLFFDWYLFTRPISGSDLPPAQYALEIDEFQKLHGESKEVFGTLAQCEHSLLQLVKVKADFVFFKDLLRGRKVKVPNGELLLTLEKGDICDVRLIQHEDHFLFTKGFCSHPVGANRFILKEVKTMRKAEPQEQENFQLELLRMFFRKEQYEHLKCEQVYSRESRLRF